MHWNSKRTRFLREKYESQQTRLTSLCFVNVESSYSQPVVPDTSSNVFGGFASLNRCWWGLLLQGWVLTCCLGVGGRKSRRRQNVSHDLKVADTVVTSQRVDQTAAKTTPQIWATRQRNIYPEVFIMFSQMPHPPLAWLYKNCSIFERCAQKRVVCLGGTFSVVTKRFEPGGEDLAERGPTAKTQKKLENYCKFGWGWLC